MGKSAYMRITSALKKTYPKFLKIIQETDFDMGFQKINYITLNPW
jgi:D-alanyl-D-alanine carboxypeptidase